MQDFTSYNDYIDSRDLEDKLQELLEEKNELLENLQDSEWIKENLDADEQKELAADFENFCELYYNDNIEDYDLVYEIEILKEDVDSPEWEGGITFINEAYFDDYAKDYMEQLFDIPSDLEQYFDYESFIEDLQNDFTDVDFNGWTFYYHA